jgi:hypothetical protein
MTIHKLVMYYCYSIADAFSLVLVNIPLIPAEVYSIQQYVEKFVSDLRQVGGFFVLRFPPAIQLTAMI